MLPPHGKILDDVLGVVDKCGNIGCSRLRTSCIVDDVADGANTPQRHRDHIVEVDPWRRGHLEGMILDHTGMTLK